MLLIVIPNHTMYLLLRYHGVLNEFCVCITHCRCEKEHEMVMFKSTEVAALQATIDELEEKLLKVCEGVFMRRYFA